MKLNELKPNAGSVKEKKRVGRGTGSGLGKTSGRGHKGAGQRSGNSRQPGFEGGQMPLVRRLPRRGFSNEVFATHYAIVNLGDLECFDNGAVIGLEELKQAGLIKKELAGVKVLARGEFTKKLTIKAAKFSDAAKEKIESNGGKTEVI